LLLVLPLNLVNAISMQIVIATVKTSPIQNIAQKNTLQLIN